MQKSSCRLQTSLLLLFLLFNGEMAFAKKMYRWVDEKGNIYFSDQVPPDQVEHERKVLDKNAKVVDVTEKAKTKEQIEMDMRLEKLRLEQKKIIDKQAAYDKVLLSTFRNLTDMQAALDNKMQAFDSKRRILDGNVQRVDSQLTSQQQQAANFERNGKPVPAELLTVINTLKQQLDQAHKDVNAHLAEKEKARKEFETDIARFKYLTQGYNPEEQKPATETKASTGNLLGVFVCQTTKQCEKAWQSAAQFVANHSTTGADIETERLIMRSAPLKTDDISLSVSKLQLENEQQQLFLDIRCHQSNVGLELCASERVQNLRPAFAQFIESALTSP